MSCCDKRGMRLEKLFLKDSFSVELCSLNASVSVSAVSVCFGGLHTHLLSFDISYVYCARLLC